MKTNIELLYKKQIPIFYCMGCREYVAAVMFDKNDDGEPVTSPVDDLLYCPLCGIAQHRRTPTVINPRWPPADHQIKHWQEKAGRFAAIANALYQHVDHRALSSNEVDNVQDMFEEVLPYLPFDEEAA